MPPWTLAQCTKTAKIAAETSQVHPLLWYIQSLKTQNHDNHICHCIQIPQSLWSYSLVVVRLLIRQVALHSSLRFHLVRFPNPLLRDFWSQGICLGIIVIVILTIIFVVVILLIIIRQVAEQWAFEVCGEILRYPQCGQWLWYQPMKVQRCHSDDTLIHCVT